MLPHQTFRPDRLSGQWWRRVLGGAALFCATAVPALAAPPPSAPGLDKVGHILVIILENHSFDQLFWNFPGADGLQGKAVPPQTDPSGQPYAFLPLPGPDTRLPHPLPNAPFVLDPAQFRLDAPPDDPSHAFWLNQQQINGGKNDRYVALSNLGGLVMGVRDIQTSALWRYAKDYTLADQFFAAAFGGSFLNHIWLACACMPSFPDAPASLRVPVNAHGQQTGEGIVMPEGAVVNGLYGSGPPFLPLKNSGDLRLPPQTAPTLGDRLSEKGIGWAWYAGGWAEALAGQPDSSFRAHHQPYAYFASYGPGTAGRADHLKDERDLIAALRDGSLPPVSFFKPLGKDNMHPGYSTFAAGDAKADQIIRLLQASPVWKDSVVIVTFDESGGFYDHVAPPKADRWGPGTRIPALVISPLARKGFVDHTSYDATAILRLIEARFGLEPLGPRDAQAGDLSRALLLTEEKK